MPLVGLEVVSEVESDPSESSSYFFFFFFSAEEEEDGAGASGEGCEVGEREGVGSVGFEEMGLGDAVGEGGEDMTRVCMGIGCVRRTGGDYVQVVCGDLVKGSGSFQKKSSIENSLKIHQWTTPLWIAWHLFEGP